MNGETKHCPLGSMCMACTKLHEDCSHLPFNKYPPHSKDEQWTYVICKEFKRDN